MASSRKTGTNEEVATYGTGKTYTSLATWEAATAINLVTAAKSCVLEVYGNGYDDVISMNGATCNASYFRIIRPAAGNFLASGAITAYHFNDTWLADSCGIWAEHYSQVQDMVWKKTINSGTSYYVFKLDIDSTNPAVIGCVAIDSTNAGTGTMTGFFIKAGGTGNKCFAINCLAHNCDGDGFILIWADGGNSYCYNCTATNNTGYGFDGNYSPTLFLKNCGATGNGTDIDTANLTRTTCSASAPTFAAGTDNFHLDAADSVWKDAGTDLSADASYAFDDDIDFATRTGTWDIGFDEVTAAGGVDITGTETLKFAESLD